MKYYNKLISDKIPNNKVISNIKILKRGAFKEKIFLISEE